MDFRQWLLNTVLIIPAILIAFTIHSYAQAKVADKLGDKNPRLNGRLTLNPAAHMDLIGFLMILLVQFGWGKPVETNPRAYKHYYKDDLKVRVSGILANFSIAVISAIIFGILHRLYYLDFVGANYVLINVVAILILVFRYIIQINCMFAIINIIPIPGLDGFHIFRDLFPKQYYKIADSMLRYQLFILIIFILPIGSTSLAGILVGIPSTALAQLLINIVL